VPFPSAEVKRLSLLLSIEPSIVEDAVASGEGVPTPMLAVTGLPQSALDKHLKTVNSHLPPILGFKFPSSMSRAFVHRSTSFSLWAGHEPSRDQAPSGLDQSKVPFSKRKAVFSMRFLYVVFLFHSPLP